MAASNEGWIFLSSASGGTGNGTVTYQVAPNPSFARRTAKLIIGGWTFTVTQEGRPCIYAVSPSVQSLPITGVIAVARVQAPCECPWTAVSQADWITVVSGTIGSGNGQVINKVAPNPGTTPRAGTLTIAGQTVTVTQPGTGESGCPPE